MKSFTVKLKLPVILLAVVGLLIFLHYTGWLAWLEQPTVRILAPAQQRLYWLGSKINNLYRSNGLQKPEELEVQRNALLIENAQLKQILAEQQAVNSQTDFLIKRGYQAVPARIIGRSFQSDSQILIIDRGWQDGLSAGLPAIVEGGIIVAKVFEVDKYTSKILLINDSQSSLAGRLSDSPRIQGAVAGERGLSLKIELIPKDQPLAIGAVVVTSGLETNIPAGLVIGTVEQVSNDASGWFKVAYLKSVVNFSDLLVVSVLLPQQHD